MKIFLLFIGLALYSTSFAQTNISADSASKHIGEKVTICTNVLEQNI